MWRGPVYFPRASSGTIITFAQNSIIVPELEWQLDMWYGCAVLGVFGVLCLFPCAGVGAGGVARPGRQGRNCNAAARCVARRCCKTRPGAQSPPAEVDTPGTPRPVATEPEESHSQLPKRKGHKRNCPNAAVPNATARTQRSQSQLPERKGPNQWRLCRGEERFECCGGSPLKCLWVRLQRHKRESCPASALPKVDCAT